MILLYPLLILWLTCGTLAARQAHRGLKRGCEEETGPGDYPLGGMWVIWGPFLVGLVALGVVSLVCVTMIDRSEAPPVDVKGEW